MADQDGYDLAPPPAPRAALPVTGAAAASEVLTYRARKADAADPDAIRNLYMPLWLLGGGVAVEAAAVLIRTPDAKAVAAVGIDVIVGTVLMLGGILVAARLRGIGLGGFWTAVLKLAAISIAPSAALTLVSPVLRVVPLGMILGWVGQFVLYFALIGALFDLDQGDTWFCVMVIFLVKVTVMIGLVVLALHRA
jgi:hypothetical protein